ncbi:hypothetical protein JZU46_02785 [bacterium]|nr:hypothetical protein [bacterium]
MALDMGSLVDMPKPDYEYITREDRAKEVLSILANYPVLEVDTEGTALDPYECRTTLMQIGIPNKAFVFDVRSDLPDINIHGSLFKDILSNKTQLKLLQNANYDMKVLKVQYGYYIENVYDTMLAEQLLYLGIQVKGFSLAKMVEKYLGMYMSKEPQGTFQIYDQEFTDKQLSYAANDVCALDIIRNMQMPRMLKYDLQEVLALEMSFIKPLAEMELNGITLDIPKWRIMMAEFEKEAIQQKADIEEAFAPAQDQFTLFGISNVNIDSPKQLVNYLGKLGLKLESTSVEALSKYAGHPIIDGILLYRKNAKLLSTYGEALIDKINPKTGRLHTSFKQMVSTGRMSSNDPNLQNIPGKQKFRSCFVAEKGKVLITVDQNSAELMIMGAMSGEPNFINTYKKQLDLHTVNAARVYNVPYDEVTKDQRKASKAISFGLAYGISAVGLGKRLGISKEVAQKLIDAYFKVNHVLSAWLNKAAKDAVRTHSSTTITGRHRFYAIPAMNDPSRKKIVGSVERAAKNHRIQGSDSDTIKKAMILCVERLAELNVGARLLLSVHDEIVVECSIEHAEEVAKLVMNAVDDGFNQYFPEMPMYTDAVVGPCWIKGECGNKVDGVECGHNRMEFKADAHYGSTLVCKKCGASQDNYDTSK